jgi:hypothetical protein
MVPFTEPVKRMVSALLPSAKEARGKEVLNKRDNNNERKNRFISNSCRKYPVFLEQQILTAILYHAGFLKAIPFMNRSELQIAFSGKSGYG